MTLLENVIAAMERILLPKLERIEAEQKALRELMEEKFRSLDQRFTSLEETLLEKAQGQKEKTN